MHILLPVQDHQPLPALQAFLRRLLERGVVDLVLAPLRTPGGTITPTLVSDPRLLDYADPLAPVLANNAAALVGKLSYKEPRPRVGAVLRSCELRALVELTKMQQASLKDLTLIAVDCAGAYSVADFQQAGLGEEQKGLAEWRRLWQAAVEHPEAPDSNLRMACKICEQPVFAAAQARIELFGSPVERGIWVWLTPELAQALGYSEQAAEGPQERAAILDRLTSARLAAREAAFAEMRARLEGEAGLQGVFAACIRCHNCMTVCPICYCKTCVFKSSIFDHEPMQFVTWTRQKGAYRLPADTMLFHLTRLNHMALSCVGCGMCTDACPAELPVGLVFRAIGQRLQETFAYVPGRSLEEPLPLVTFKADEWTEVGE